MVELRPMRADDVAVLLASSLQQFGDEAVRFGRWTPASRDARLTEMAGRFSDGEQPGSHYRDIWADGEVVGHLWYAILHDEAYVYDLLVEPAYRGKGYARAAMQCFAREAAAQGVAQLALNVFSENDVARRLYASLGYVAVSQQMVLPLKG
jgi:ribosomal protein S18 acetylase RimI-like enzyme